MAKSRRRLVVDACIARSAGETVNPVSKTCRDVLDHIYDARLKMVRTPEISAEWNKHSSAYTRAWLQRMINRRLDFRLEMGQDAELRTKISDAVATPQINEILQKDCHLIEAALATDKIVISIETRCRDHFGRIKKQVAELRKIGWVHPLDDPSSSLNWLKAGAQMKTCPRLPSPPV